MKTKLLLLLVWVQSVCFGQTAWYPLAEDDFQQTFLRRRNDIQKIKEAYDGK